MSFIDIYVHKDSPIHRVDPRVKIIGAILLTVLSFFSTDLLFLVATLILLQALIVVTGVSWNTYSSSFWIVARFAILLTLLWPFFDKAGDPVLLDLAIYKVTLPSLLSSIALALRIFVIASGWFLLLFTTTQSGFVRGLVKLGFPYDIGLSLSIALRYIPHFIETMNQVKDAQVSRGFDIDRGGLIKRVKNFVPVLIPTFVIALRTSEGLSHALVSRGYGISRDRTYYRDIRLRALDIVLIISICTIVPVLIYLSISRIIHI